MELLKNVPDYIQQILPYVPGKPIEEVAREFNLPVEKIIKLASNENPFGPSPLALVAIQESFLHSNLYPDGSGYYLKQALGKKLDLNPECFVLGCGSNEVMELLFHAFTDRPNGHVILSKHAFVIYKLIAQLLGVKYIEVADSHFGHDLNAFEKAITSETRIIFLVSPNNPTGTRIPNDELKKFVQKIPEHIILVIDEAYYEFLHEPPPSVEWLRKKKNLILLRTFSKIYGLAGLRIGYGIMHPEVAKIVQKCRQPFNTTSAAQVGAITALEDIAHIEKTRKNNFRELQKLELFCRNHHIHYIPSDGNFLTIEVPDSEQLFINLMKEGIIIRPLKGYELKNWVRISIGTEQEMNILESALKKALRLA
jgi:histidinol-phosphate aminotransferase